MYRILLLCSTSACATATIYNALPYQMTNSPVPAASGALANRFGHSGADYIDLFNMINEMENFVLEKLSSITTKPPLNNSQRHYAMLIGMLLTISKAFTESKEDRFYDEIYMATLDKMAPRVWEDPVAYADEAVGLIKLTREVTAPTLPTSYGADMKSLLAFGNVAVEFGDLRELFDEVSNDYNSIHFLIKERMMLKPLIYSIAKGLRILKSKDLNTAI